jgi:hypothetical protein
MVHTSQALAAIDVCQKEKDKGLFAPSSAYLVHSVELFEIIHHAVLLLYDHSAVSETFAQKVALPHSQEKKNALDVALQFDHCLSKWEQDLPLPLQHGAHLSVGDEMQQKQAIALRLRCVHSSPEVFHRVY